MKRSLNFIYSIDEVEEESIIIIEVHLIINNRKRRGQKWEETHIFKKIPKIHILIHPKKILQVSAIWHHTGAASKDMPRSDGLAEQWFIHL
jgi:hypothetical protein